MDLSSANKEWQSVVEGPFKPHIRNSLKYLHVFEGEHDADNDDVDTTGALMVLSDDRVYGVGYNGEWGLLGLEGDEVYPEQRVDPLCRRRVTCISVGGTVGAATTANGDIFIWGRDVNASWEDEADMFDVHEPYGSAAHRFVRVACGQLFVAALTTVGEVVLWGLIDNNAQPVENYIIRTDPIQSFAAGAYHIAMLSRSGQVYTCGFGSNGALGRRWNTRERYLQAKTVDLDHRTIEVACGANSTLFLLENGSLFATGLSSEDEGHLGVSRELVDDDGVVSDPERVVINQGVKKIAAVMTSGNSIYAALTEHGHIFTWGCDEFPSKKRGETRLISAFYNEPIPSHLGHVIQPHQQESNSTTPPGVRTYSNSTNVSAIVADLNKVYKDVGNMIRTMAPLLEREKALKQNASAANNRR